MRLLAIVFTVLAVVGIVGRATQPPQIQPSVAPAERRPGPFKSFDPRARSVVAVDNEAWGISPPAEGDYLALDGTPLKLGGDGPSNGTILVPDTVRGVPMSHVIPIHYSADGPTAGSSGMLWESYTLRYEAGELVLERVDGIADDADFDSSAGMGFGLWEPVTPESDDLVWLTYETNLSAKLTGKLASWSETTPGTAVIAAPGALGPIPIMHLIELPLTATGSYEPTAAASEPWTVWTGSINANNGAFIPETAAVMGSGNGVPDGATVAKLGRRISGHWADGLSSGAIERRAVTLPGEPKSYVRGSVRVRVQENLFSGW